MTGTFTFENGEDAVYWRKRALGAERLAEEWERKARTSEHAARAAQEQLRQMRPVGTAEVISAGGVNDHPCPAARAWWATRDQERYTVGPHLTEADCAAAAREAADAEDAPYEVADCLSNHIDLSKWFNADEWLEGLYDLMDDEDGADETGANHPLDEITSALSFDLQASVRSAIWHWQNRKALKLKAWYFKYCDATQTVNPGAFASADVSAALQSLNDDLEARLMTISVLIRALDVAQRMNVRSTSAPAICPD